jgi:hypothetical protein
MRHEGDSEWFNYRFPDEPSNVDVVLRRVRGEADYDDYHAQLNLSATAILNQVNSNWLSNTYALRLFDRYLNTYKGTNWRDGYVIENAFIDEDDVFQKWSTTKEPMLVNVFSNYWLLLDCKVVPVNNVYVSLCLWMHMLRKTRVQARKSPFSMSHSLSHSPPPLRRVAHRLSL